MEWSIFDIIGPIMIGPSSSHTAGACNIGFLGYCLNKGVVRKSKIILFGSFAKVYKGHGTDWAIVAGLLGMRSDNEENVNSFAIAKKMGMEFEFEFDTNTPVDHPNTVKIEVFDNRKAFNYVAISIGGGSVFLKSINDIPIKDIDGREAKYLYIGNSKEELFRERDIFAKSFTEYEIQTYRDNFILHANANKINSIHNTAGKIDSKIDDIANYLPEKYIFIPKL